MSACLIVSVVTFRSPREELEACLEALLAAFGEARGCGLLDRVKIALVDNSPVPLRPPLRLPAGAGPEVELHYFHGHGNVGFGRGHNLGQARMGEGGFRLVLNADVTLAPDALAEGLRALAQETDAVWVCPQAHAPDGRPAYLCKRYPTVLDLALRGLAPKPLRRAFADRLAIYEMRDRTQGDEPVRDVAIASGCCMLLRAEAFDAVGGFDERYFLYFEDFDFSIRVRRIGTILYWPRMRIVHAGGGAASKGWRHRWLFLRSARLFFQQHGWRWM